MANYKVLIWSEFPPNTKTGISIINNIILNILKQNNISTIVKEEYAWNKNLIRTILHHFSNYIIILNILIRNDVENIYFTFTLSRGGILKMLLIFPFIKLFSNKTKLIGHIHRGDFEIFANSSLINRFLLKIYSKFLYKTVILSSEFIQPIRKLINKPLYILPNTSPLEGTTVNAKKYSKEFICIANYISTKGLTKLVNSFANPKLKDFKLTIYGNIYDNNLYKNLSDIATKNILLKTELKRERLVDVLSKFDALIVPSENEGQPIVILEAMSIKLPVIASKTGDIPNMLGTNYPFLLDPFLPSQIEEKIILFDKYEKKSELANYLFERYNVKYSKQIFEKRVLELFN